MKKFKDYEELIDKNLNYLKNNKLGYFIDSQKNTLKKKLNTDDIFRHLDESIKIKEEKISIIYNDVNENTQKNIEKLESSKKELELLISKINEDIKEDKNYYNNQLKDFDNIVANLKDKNEIYVKSYQELLRLKKYLNKNI
ncbi:gas vesicle protein, partial [Marinitoga litoralis]